MPRLRIIVLDQADQRTYRCVFWADVSAARQPFYAKPAGTVSVWKDALAADNSNLVSGAVAEHVDIVQVPQGTPLAQAQSMLQNKWQSVQDRVTNTNLWSRYGTTWDGTSWVAGGVA